MSLYNMINGVNPATFIFLPIQEILDYAEICYGVFSFKQRDKFIEHIKEIYYDE